MLAPFLLTPQDCQKIYSNDPIMVGLSLVRNKNAELSNPGAEQVGFIFLIQLAARLPSG
jgi:hypothetical protein